MADCGIGGVVSGGITVLCRHIHTIAHGESDAFCLAVLTCGQGELAGRPDVKHHALRDQGLVQRHGHCCAVRYIVGLFAGGLVSSNSQGIGHILVTVFHSNSAAGHGQRVAARSIGVELPTGMEGDVLRNCGFVHIKELAILAIFGVPAGELVTRTDGIMDGSQFVCLGISDFFGLINRHLSGVGQGAAIGIKGHLAEVKKIAVFQIGVGRVCKQFICIGFIAVIVDGTIGSVNRDRISIFIKNGLSIFVLFPIFIYLPSCTSLQALLERSQPGRECNVFQIKAIVKGIRFNGCYFFRDGDGLEGFATFKSLLANLSHTVRQSDRGKIFARGKSPLANDFNAPRQGECVKTITLAKGTFVDFF